MSDIAEAEGPEQASEQGAVDLTPSCSAAFTNGANAFLRCFKNGEFHPAENAIMPDAIHERREWWDGFFGAAESVICASKSSLPNALMNGATPTPHDHIP